MRGMKLLIANKNYSSWSLRPWLLLKQAGIPFEEEKLSFNAPDFKARLGRESPSGLVPVLFDGGLVIWDSLAITEYLAETFPAKKLWPEDRAARARARSMCAEMHAGFQTLRGRMTMNCSLRLTNVLFDKQVRRQQARLVEMWRDARERHGAGGPFLFGHFTAADAFFAPVAIRFTAYGVELPPVARQYVDTLYALPALQEWIAAGQAENDYVDSDEPYRESL
jgi:glutathione S-transferase